MFMSHNKRYMLTARFGFC